MLGFIVNVDFHFVFNFNNVYPKNRLIESITFRESSSETNLPNLSLNTQN